MRPLLMPSAGERFGRLVVEGPGPALKSGNRSISCICDCGTHVPAASLSQVLAGKTSSCGCRARESAAAINYRHGESTNRTNSVELSIWYGMLDRCRNPNNRAWESYGGRGIEVRFRAFEDFLAEIGRRPSPRHSVDRIRNEGHYEVGNVRWATPSEQARNRRKKRPHTRLKKDGTRQLRLI